MTTKDKLNITKKVGEFAIGWTIGSIAATTTKPKGIVDAVLCVIGASALSFTADRIFVKEFDKYCKEVFNVDMEQFDDE